MKNKMIRKAKVGVRSLICVHDVKGVSDMISPTDWVNCRHCYYKLVAMVKTITYVAPVVHDSLLNNKPSDKNCNNW